METTAPSEGDGGSSLLERVTITIGGRPSSGGALLSLASLLIACDEILEDVLVADLVSRGHPIDQEDALEVVELVLDDATGEARELLFLFNAVDREEADLAAVRTTERKPLAGE